MSGVTVSISQRPTGMNQNTDVDGPVNITATFLVRGALVRKLGRSWKKYMK